MGTFLAPAEKSDLHVLGTQFTAITGEECAGRYRGARRHQNGPTQDQKAPGEDHWSRQARAELVGRGEAQPEPGEVAALAAQLRARGEAFVKELARWLRDHHGHTSPSVLELMIGWLLRDCGWQIVQNDVWTLSSWMTREQLSPIYGPDHHESNPWPWRGAERSPGQETQEQS